MLLKSMEPSCNAANNLEAGIPNCWRIIMVYASNRANIFMCEEHMILLQISESKIGCSYPRLFLYLGEDCCNWDLALNQIWPMKESDYNDWLSDACEIAEEEAWEVLKNYVNEEAFRSFLNENK